MVSGEFETSDLDLDLQGQIYHESLLKVCAIPCEFELLNHFEFTLYIHVSDEFKTGALDLDHQD